MNIVRENEEGVSEYLTGLGPLYVEKADKTMNKGAFMADIKVLGPGCPR